MKKVLLCLCVIFVFLVGCGKQGSDFKTDIVGKYGNITLEETYIEWGINRYPYKRLGEHIIQVDLSTSKQYYYVDGSVLFQIDIQDTFIKEE